MDFEFSNEFAGYEETAESQTFEDSLLKLQKAEEIKTIRTLNQIEQNLYKDIFMSPQGPKSLFGGTEDPLDNAEIQIWRDQFTFLQIKGNRVSVSGPSHKDSSAMASINYGVDAR